MAEKSATALAPARPAAESVLSRLRAPVPAWRAALLAIALAAGATLLRPALTPVLGPEPLFVIAYPATVIAAWYGGFLAGAAVTVALAAITPGLVGMGWDARALSTAALYLTFGLLISALCQSLHDARARLQRRADVLEARALSEERLAAALDATGLTLLDLDAGLRFAWIRNPPLGFDAAQLLGRTAEEVFPPAQAERLRAAWLGVLHGGPPLRRDFLLTGPQGTRLLEHVIVPLRRPGEERPVGVRGALSDVTELRAERARRLEEQALFRAAQEQSLDPFELLLPVRSGGDRGGDAAAAEGEIVDFVWEYANPAAAAMCGRPAAELVGRRVLARGARGGPDAFQRARFEHWREAMAAPGPRRAEFRRDEEGTTGWYRSLSVRVGDRLACTTVDATAQTRWLNAERSARAALQRAARLRDDFLAHLSHELRTPLNAISGWAHVLQRGEGDAALMQRAAEAIGRNARSQAALIDELLDMNRIVAGRLKLERAPLELGGVLLAAVEAARPAAQAKWIRLQSQGVARDVGCHGDARRLQQVFAHLLSNAVKFTPLNGEIRVSLERLDGKAMVEVADSGEGVSAEVMPHVFDRFQRPAMPGTGRQSGLGLGLAIVKSLVEAHAGRVSLHSPGHGQGTTVRVQLPAGPLEAAGTIAGRTAEAGGPDDAAAAARPGDAVPAGSTSSAGSGSGSGSDSDSDSDSGPGPGPGRGTEDVARRGAVVVPGRPGADGAEADAPLTWRRILVLEDEADSLELLCLLLRRHGAIVRAFDNAEQALAAAEHSSFDLVISDLGMPGMDGLEFMRRLQRRPVPLKAIALTAYAGDRQREEALKAGFSRVETKPISPPEFLATVTAALAETRAAE